MNHRKDRDFQVLIYESEYRQIQAWVDKHQHLETGGDLFGLWVDDHTAVVQLVLGPGKNCRRTSVSFYQDVDYLDRVGNQLTHNEGLCHIGEWHSHHRLGLSRPSGGDENTVWTNMDRYGINRFFLFIATIEGSFLNKRDKNSLSYDVKVSSFLFETSTERREGVLKGNFKFIGMKNPQSPFRKKVKELAIGAESQNSENELKRFKQSGSYILISSNGKPKADTRNDSNSIIMAETPKVKNASYKRDNREMSNIQETQDQQHIKKPRQMSNTTDPYKRDQKEMANNEETHDQQDMNKSKEMVITTTSYKRDQGEMPNTEYTQDQQETNKSKEMVITTTSYKMDQGEMPNTEETQDQQDIKKPRQMSSTTDPYKRNQKEMSNNEETHNQQDMDKSKEMVNTTTSYKMDQGEMSNTEETQDQQDMDKSKEMVITTTSCKRDQEEMFNIQETEVRDQQNMERSKQMVITIASYKRNQKKKCNTRKSRDQQDMEKLNEMVIATPDSYLKDRKEMSNTQETQDQTDTKASTASTSIRKDSDDPTTIVKNIKQQDDENNIEADDTESKTGRVKNHTSTTETNIKEKNKQQNKPSSCHSDERYVTPNGEIPNVFDHSDLNNRSTNHSAEKIQQPTKVVVVSKHIENNKKYMHNEIRRENDDNENKTDNQLQSTAHDILDTQISNDVQGDERSVQKDIYTKETTARHVESKGKETHEDKHHESYVVQDKEGSTDKSTKVKYVGSKDRGNNMNTNQPTQQESQDPSTVTLIQENTTREPQQKYEDNNTKDVVEELENVKNEANPNIHNFSSAQSDVEDCGCFWPLCGTKKRKGKNKNKKEKKRSEKQKKQQKENQEKKEKKKINTM